MAFVQDDDMIETFAPDRTDDALDVRRLPGRPRCGQHFRDPHASQALVQLDLYIDLPQFFLPVAMLVLARFLLRADPAVPHP